MIEMIGTMGIDGAIIMIGIIFAVVYSIFEIVSNILGKRRVK